MNRQAQAVVLLLLGGAVVKASVTDLYLRYVKEGLRPFLIAAGLVLIAAAIMTLWYDWRASRSTEVAHDDDDGHGHAHHGGGPRVGWLLIAPVLGLLLVVPPALGSYAASQSGTALAGAQTSDFPPLPAGDPARISMLDYASRAVYDKGLSIGARKVQVTGFVLAGPNGEQYLARMMLSCCAADARPVKIGLAGDEAPGSLAADTWLEVVGTYTDRQDVDTVNGETIPYLRVVEWRRIPAPKKQYEG